MGILKIVGAIAIGIFLFMLYPAYNQLATYWITFSTSITGYTPDAITALFFKALPLIGLIMIFYIVWKIATSSRRV